MATGESRRRNERLSSVERALNSNRPTASLSLDLDNKWSYMKIHGDEGWERYPSYLDLVVPRVLAIMERLELKATFFTVGQDAARPENAQALAQLTRAGHEVGNHSFHHEPWLHLYTEAEVEAEIGRAEEAILAATGMRPRGFRGPGFSFSPTVLKVLKRRGYEYDASTFPTYLGPLARAYYFMTARMSAEERAKRKMLFGSLAEGLRPLKPYYWQLDEGPLLEIPVTTVPLVKVPFHLSYVLFLAGFSEMLARAYFRSALTACRVAGVEPSLLLHPLDFLGGDDVPELKFFPAMGMPGGQKARIAEGLLDIYRNQFEVVAMGAHAERLRREPPRRTIVPRLIQGLPSRG